METTFRSEERFTQGEFRVWLDRLVASGEITSRVIPGLAVTVEDVFEDIDLEG